MLREDVSAANGESPQIADDQSFPDHLPGPASSTSLLASGLLDVEDQSPVLKFGPQIPILLNSKSVVQYARGYRTPSLFDFAVESGGILFDVHFFFSQFSKTDIA